MNIFQNILRSIQDRLKISEADLEKTSIVISKIIGIEIKREVLSINGKVLIIKTSPILRNEIFIKKEHLLEALKNNSLIFSDIQVRVN